MFSNDEQIVVGHRAVTLKCEGFMPPISIQAIYRESNLIKLAEKECLALEAAKIDADGL